MKKGIAFLSLILGLHAGFSPLQAQDRRLYAQSKRGSEKSRRLYGETQYVFKQANIAYRAGKFKEAASLFSRVLKSSPDHEPSRILLAKALFRLDRYEESYQIFRTLNPKTLDVETSFEYGKSFFDHEQYDEAYNAFNQVPEGHDLYDLACYYGAISGVKLRRYRDAERMIENAVVLPGKLIRSRNLYKQHIQQILQKEQEELLNRDKAAEERRLREQTRVFREKLNEQPGDRAPKDVPELSNEIAHDGFFAVPKGAEVGFVRRQQFVDFNRENTQDNTHHTSFFHFQNGFQKILSRKERASTSAFGLGLHFSIWDRNFSDTELLVNDTPERVMIYRTFDGGKKGNQKLGIGSAELWYEKALSNALWTGFKLGAMGAYPEFKSTGSLMNRYVEFLIGRKRSGFQTSFFVDYVQMVDHKGKIYTETLQETIQGTVALPQDVGLEVKLRAQQLKYPEKEAFIEGPSSNVRAHANAYTDFPFRVRMGLEGYFQINENYRKETLNVAMGEKYKWEQHDVYGAAYITASPLTWLKFEVRGSRFQRLFYNVDPESEEAEYNVEQYQPNFISEATISVMANLLF